jgi:hypothetical protein
MSTAPEYPGFEYKADQLSRFLNAGELFTIKLVNGEIIHHEVREHISFRDWLLANSVVDIKVEIDSMAI